MAALEEALMLEHGQEYDLISQAKRLGEEQLIACLKRLVTQDREVTARLLVHFGEVDARGLYRDQAYQSMFEYAVHALHMSESEAGLRIRVSRLGRQFPVALEMLARGELHLTALKLLAPVLTRDNLWLLEAARFKSKQQVLADSRHIPHAVRREVLARDGEQCSFVSADGRRCPARGALEFHHQTPHARGGAATADNIQTLCRAHNALLAERDYGRTFMRERIEQRRAAATSATAVGRLVPTAPAKRTPHIEQRRAAAAPGGAMDEHASEPPKQVSGVDQQLRVAQPARAIDQQVPELANASYIDHQLRL
jgi:5-methylcytosine-specific restriction endonuclease McrA